MKSHLGTHFLAVLLVVAAASDGRAQVGQPNLPTAASRPSVSVQDELWSLRQRMEQYELEMERLQRRLEQSAASGKPTAATPIGLGDRTLTCPEAATDQSGGNDIKFEQVDIQTKPSIKLRGRLFFDQVMFDDDSALALDRENESGFDTARIGMYGNIFENVKYQIEVEFEGTETDFKTVYIELTKLPYLGNFRAGHFYEPIAGIEENSGSRYQEFMERPIGVTAFIPSRSFGYMLHNTVHDENLYYAVGTFRHESDDSPNRRGTIVGDAGDWVLTSRIAWNPYYDEPSHGRYLVHLGFGYSYRTDATLVEFNTISELGNQAGFLASSVPGDDNYSLFTPEFLTIWGPWSVQSEFTSAVTGTANFWGGYVEASYFLTGDHRGYRRSDKTVSRPVIVEDFFSVKTPFGLVHGTGGWEIKARWSHVDLREGAGANRGLQNNWSAGFNWYLNSYTRVMFDYVYEDVSMSSGVRGFNHNFGTRIQVQW